MPANNNCTHSFIDTRAKMCQYSRSAPPFRERLHRNTQEELLPMITWGSFGFVHMMTFLAANYAPELLRMHLFRRVRRYLTPLF